MTLRNEYLEAYTRRMRDSPPDVHRFCDPQVPEERRRELVAWIRSIDDPSSGQYLQIRYAMSVPNDAALEAVAELKRPVVSMASGFGYWEHLLRLRGVDVQAFDINADSQHFHDMSYLRPMKGDPSVLQRDEFADAVLFLAWPDGDEHSKVSDECLKYFRGPSIVHVGELFGETAGENPFGMSTNYTFQLDLIKTFRLARRVDLPRWPGHRDSLTIWNRTSTPVVCGDGPTKFVYF